MTFMLTLFSDDNNHWKSTMKSHIYSRRFKCVLMLGPDVEYTYSMNFIMIDCKFLNHLSSLDRQLMLHLFCQNCKRNGKTTSISLRLKMNRATIRFVEVDCEWERNKMTFFFFYIYPEYKARYIQFSLTCGDLCTKTASKWSNLTFTEEHRCQFFPIRNICRPAWCEMHSRSFLTMNFYRFYCNKIGKKTRI